MQKKEESNQRRNKEVKMQANTHPGPQHEMAKTAVLVPTVINYALVSGENKLQSVFIQWFGEADSPYMPKDAQFFFDTGHDKDDPVWLGHIDTFKVVFIGQIQYWPNPDVIGSMMEMTGGTPTTNIVWMMSPVSLGIGRPSSSMMRVIVLGDPVCGVIEPRLYVDLTVRDKVMAELEANMSLADKLLANPTMELPAEDVTWADEWPSCNTCEPLEHSHRSKPGVPPGGNRYDLSYLCPVCGRRWWQYNDHFHLWKHVKNQHEWDSIRRTQIYKDAGLEPFED